MKRHNGEAALTSVVERWTYSFVSLLLFLLLAWPLCTSATETQGQQKQSLDPFSSDAVITEHGESKTAKVFAAPIGLRTEGEENGRKFVVILRFDRNLIWRIFPAEKLYVEEVADPAQTISMMFSSAEEQDCSILGEEQVGDMLCVKEQCSVTMGGEKLSETHWIAKDMGGLIIKYSYDNMAVEYRNIKYGPQDQTLFDVPADYTKEGS